MCADTTSAHALTPTELHSERYRHDYLANLTQRERLSGTNIALKETYTYDALQRLISTAVGGSSNNVSLDYDAVGNLTKKSDYASTYTYPSGAVRPNAVSSTSGGPTGTIYYAYDNSGNLIGRSPNADPYITNYQTFQARYNHNQQPIESVTLTGTGATARWESARYLYDAQNRLSRQIEGANGSTPEHLIYLEGYEDRVGGYRTRSYVDDYAHLTRYRYGQLELRFVLTDRLGSVVGVVHADRDSSGHISTLTAESTLAYDVFGTPRHATSWARLGVDEAWPQATPPGQSTPTTRHGFTGHEMLSKQRLIHMRGRLFDPRMGRFTGVDPVIQFPLSTQGLNPYSYLLNNPLAGTDPTGYVADWESVQERMWAMAGGFGANGSTTTAVLNGLRSAATAVGMSGAAGDAKAAGGSAPTSAAGGRADNGGNVTQAAQKGATPDQPSDIESPTLLPQIVVVAETRAERLARKAVGRDAWALFGIQGSTALVGGGLAAGPEIAGMYYANGEKIVGAGVLTLEALAGDAVGGASIALPVGAVGARALTEVTEYAAPYFSGGAAKGAEGAFSLLGANRAVIDPRKLTEYALNAAHSVGGNKARVFESALGFTKSNADDLMVQLRQGVMNNPAVAGKVDQFGARFTVDIPVTGPAGSGVVRSGWIYKTGSDTPELTTIFVK